MKSMRPPSTAIFFMTYFHKAGGGHGPLGPLDPLLSQTSMHLTCKIDELKCLHEISIKRMITSCVIGVEIYITRNDRNIRLGN